MTDQESSVSITRPNDKELVFVRIFDAPRELVWDAFTMEKHVVNWWGPHGFRTESVKHDLRVGGSWKLIMHGPDGREYKNTLNYLDVKRPEKLVYRHAGEPGDEPVTFQTEITFDDLGGKTRTTMRMVFDRPEDREFVTRTYQAEKGGVQTLSRLAEFLETIKV